MTWLNQESWDAVTVSRSQLVCPFCKEIVTEATLFSPPSELEDIVRAHVMEQHPVRWRLSAKWRKAMRVSRANAVRSARA